MEETTIKEVGNYVFFSDGRVFSILHKKFMTFPLNKGVLNDLNHLEFYDRHSICHKRPQF